MRSIIEKNFPIVFAISCFLGFTVPFLQFVPAWGIILALAFVMFISYFKIDWRELASVNLLRLSIFYTARFFLLPFILYFCVRTFSPSQALAIFLLAILPPGVSTPAMSRLFQGNISLSFALAVFGNISAPFTMPLLFSLIEMPAISIDTIGIMKSMVYLVLVPALFFLILRKRTVIHRFVKRDGAFLTVLCIGFTLAVAVAKQKHRILEDPMALLSPLMISSFGFFVFYFLVWKLLGKATWSNKISYTLSSGANNISLGISLALLYFPFDVSLFLIISELPWIFALIPFKRWVFKNR